jgi:hypothetical protein
VEEDVRLFLRVAFRRDRRERLGRMRKELVAEFDKIGRRMGRDARISQEEAG